MTQVVVLAGGLATRMHPHTLATPKSMLKIAGRPFIDWQLERLQSCGFDECVLCLGHLSDTIVAHVGDGSAFGLRVTCVQEGATLLGTGGALRHALPHLASTFVVTYGDSYLPFDYVAPLRALELNVDADVVMSVYRNEHRFEPSNVAIGAGLVTRYEKGSTDRELAYLDYGALAVRRGFVETFDEGFLDLAKPMAAQVRAGRVRAYEVEQVFYEIGSPQGLATLEKELGRQRT